ncbi:cytochrome P450 [Actinomadura sp. ATCC 31491]|uniref:Cytochrome P450 n=1 Tax=Actinomadura luzonensis TaxID=2805427 RepID=A0ABT0FUL9_9ACTN|nr:cytochrome P450 [Actinomadura luzonensis]MCK2216021.1 cytochrome P450 [Actinomadura luzonensis]
MPRGLPRASVLESLRLSAALVPPWAPHALPGRDLLRARSLLTALEARYGGRPVLVRGRRRGPALLVLSRRDVLRVLVEERDAYAPGVEERPFGLPTDVLRPAFIEIAREEAAALTTAALTTGALTTGALTTGARTTGVVDFARLDARWQRVARRCVYGDGAAGDEELTRLLTGLRRAGRRRAGRRQEVLSGRYDARILDHLRRAEPGSLAGLIAETPDEAESRGLMQAAYWLMGFGVTAGALLQTLALLATHPAHRKAARADPEHLRACLREALRLWPPVPALSRVTAAETHWYGTALPPGTPVLVPLAVHQRSPRLPYADAFTPRIWLDGTAAGEWWARPGCDAVHLTLAVGTAFLATLLRDARPKQIGRSLSPHRPIPHAVNLARLRVRMRPTRRKPARP